MPTVIALVEDLLFTSRIREAARGQAVEVRTLRRVDDVVAAVRAGAALLLVDADSDRLPWAEAIAAVRRDPATAAVPVVAFLSHVHAERAATARSEGASHVLARSAFVQALPRLLATAAATPSPEKNP
jgi:CheY-like chemotaxis protein